MLSHSPPGCIHAVTKLDNTGDCLAWSHPCTLIQSQAPSSHNLYFDQQGYVLKIVGGQDKQGFAMKQGVLTNQRVRLLMTPGDQGFRGYGRRNGTCDYFHGNVMCSRKSLA